MHVLPSHGVSYDTSIDFYKRKNLDIVADDMKKYGFQRALEISSLLVQRGWLTHSFIPEEQVIGREKEKEDIIELLLEVNEKEDVLANAIVGIGGMGKTTLAQFVFHHEEVKDVLNLIIWVCISSTFDLKAILEKIIESATNQVTSVLELDPLQNQLRNQIHGKKYLLVMDDVWNEEVKFMDDVMDDVAANIRSEMK